MKNTLTNLSIAAALSVSVSTVAQAAVVDLGFIVDRSGSVREIDYDNTMQALKTALNSIDINDDTKYAVSIVTFSSGTTVVANNILLDSVANRNALNTAIDNASIVGSQTGGTTNYEAAFEKMASLGTSGAVSILNFATDGAPNTGDRTLEDLAGEIAGLQAAGWDAMNVEAIGSGVAGSTLLRGLGFDTQITAGWDPDSDDIADFFQDGTLANGNCSSISNSSQISNPISNCFVIDTNFTDLPDAFRTKITATVNLTGGTIAPVPVPAAFPLLAAGLGMLGFVARRRRKFA